MHTKYMNKEGKTVTNLTINVLNIVTSVKMCGDFLWGVGWGGVGILWIIHNFWG